MRGKLPLVLVALLACSPAVEQAAEQTDDKGEPDGVPTAPQGGSDAGNEPAAPDGDSVAWRAGSRLQVRQSVRTGSDGSQLPGSPYLYDTQLDAPCTILTHADGVQRCFPPAITSGRSWFSDPGCTVQLASDIQPCGRKPPRDYALLAEQDSCATPRYRVYELGAEHFGSAYVVSAQGPCVSADPAPTRLFAFGNELLAEGLVGFSAPREVVIE